MDIDPFEMVEDRANDKRDGATLPPRPRRLRLNPAWP